MTQIIIFKAVSVTRLPKVPLVRRVGLIIDIWNLFVFCLLFFGALVQIFFHFFSFFSFFSLALASASAFL
jgi:hypothetical protein